MGRIFVVLLKFGAVTWGLFLIENLFYMTKSETKGYAALLQRRIRNPGVRILNSVRGAFVSKN